VQCSSCCRCVTAVWLLLPQAPAVTRVLVPPPPVMGLRWGWDRGVRVGVSRVLESTREAARLLGVSEALLRLSANGPAAAGILLDSYMVCPCCT
jgi:hypothetical protein